MSISNTKNFIPNETRIVHTATTCGMSIRAVSQKGKNEHGRNITVRFAEIKNPNRSNTDNLIGLLEQITPPKKEVKAFQISNDINYPHPPNINHNSSQLNNNNDQEKILLGQNEARPEQCAKKMQALQNTPINNHQSEAKPQIAFPMKQDNPLAEKPIETKPQGQ